MITIRNLTKAYDGVPALSIGALDIDEGRIYAVIGPNGSGKSTLLSCLAALVDYDGKIMQNGQPLPAAACAYLQQKPYLFSFSVIKNLELALRRYEKHERSAKAVEYLDLAGVAALRHKKAQKLSGGESKRVALARCLATERPLLLLDEPAGELDIHAVPLVEKAIVDYHKKHRATVILTTHNIAQAQRLAQSIVVLVDGHVAAAGGPEVLLSPPDPVKAYLQDWT